MSDAPPRERIELRVLSGRYRLDRYLGRGGMGEVHAATHLSTGARVAIKQLLPEHAADEAVCRRFVREARAATAIRHPNVIVVHDVFDDDDGTPMMVMELLEGESLAERLSRAGNLSVREAALIFVQVARALCAAHALGVVHRDLKPDNIFLARDAADQPLAKVLDFGIAKILRPSPLDAYSYGSSTHTGAIVGTLRYMSHEQAMGRDVDERTDVWSFAVTMVEALSGRRPLHYETLSEMFVAMLQQRVPRAHALVDGLPAAVASMLDACLQKERDKRAPDLKQAVSVLESYLAQPDAQPARGKRFGWTAGIVAAATVLASLSVSSWRARDLDTSRPMLRPSAQRGPSHFTLSPRATRESDSREPQVERATPSPTPASPMAARAELNEHDAGAKRPHARRERTPPSRDEARPSAPIPREVASSPEVRRRSPIIETLPE